jgi:hypothetical protein
MLQVLQLGVRMVLPILQGFHLVVLYRWESVRILASLKATCSSLIEPLLISTGSSNPLYRSGHLQQGPSRPPCGKAQEGIAERICEILQVSENAALWL